MPCMLSHAFFFFFISLAVHVQHLTFGSTTTGRRPTKETGLEEVAVGAQRQLELGRRANQANPIPCSPPPSKTPTESDSPWQHPPPPMVPPLAVVGPAVAAPSFRTARTSRLRPRKLPSWPRAALPNDEVSHDPKPAR